MAEILGNPKQPVNQLTILGKLNKVTTDTENLSKAIDVDRYLDTDTTLFKNVSDVSETTGAIDRNTSEVGRYVLGGPGNNILRQIRTLFSRQHYTVTSFAINELKAFNSAKMDNQLTNLINALEKSMNNLKLRALTADELFEELKISDPGISKGAWKKWKKDILRSTRITRGTRN